MLEIIAGPLDVYLAAVATAFPDPNQTPSVSWSLVGKKGSRNYMEEGVTIQHSQTVETFTPLGSTVARKAFRVNEETRVRLVLADVSLEAYALALNHNTVDSDNAIKSISLKRGLTVAERAVLVRGTGMSAEGENLNRQFELLRAVQVGEPEVVYQKGQPAGIAIEYLALEDDDGNVGYIRDQEPDT